jgi:hypothetical protein
VETRWEGRSNAKIMSIIETRWSLTCKGCVTHCGLAIYIFFKKNLKAKEKLWKLKYFTMKKIQSSKKPLKKKPKYFKILELKYN